MTAGLLYLGSGVGLGVVRIIQRLTGSRSKEASFRRADMPWLIGAIVSGGGVGPVLLMSLVLFVRALRELGAARTGAYFSAAPFIGAIVAIAVLREPIRLGVVAGGALMIAGLWLHLTEHHEHEHEHERLAHDHLHHHDEHHQHPHDSAVVAGEPHSHPHVHAPLRHAHPHYPDIHHRHSH